MSSKIHKPKLLKWNLIGVKFIPKVHKKIPKLPNINVFFFSQFFESQTERGAEETYLVRSWRRGARLATLVLMNKCSRFEGLVKAVHFFLCFFFYVFSKLWPAERYTIIWGFEEENQRDCRNGRERESYDIVFFLFYNLDSVFSKLLIKCLIFNML